MAHGTSQSPTDVGMLPKSDPREVSVGLPSSKIRRPFEISRKNDIHFPKTYFQGRRRALGLKEGEDGTVSEGKGKWKIDVLFEQKIRALADRLQEIPIGSIADNGA